MTKRPCSIFLTALWCHFALLTTSAGQFGSCQGIRQGSHSHSSSHSFSQTKHKQSVKRLGVLGSTEIFLLCWSELHWFSPWSDHLLYSELVVFIVDIFCGLSGYFVCDKLKRQNYIMPDWLIPKKVENDGEGGLFLDHQSCSKCCVVTWGHQA